MAGNIQHIDEPTYLQGASLWESLFQFGSPDVIAALPRTDKPTKPTALSNPTAPMAAQVLGIIGEAMNEYKNYAAARDEIIKALKQDILNQIKIGDLIPFGFKEPRDLNDFAMKIPADLFFTGDINWEKSELKYQTYEFKGVHLLADIMPVINAQVIYSEKEKNEIENIAGNKENTETLKIPNFKNSNALNQNGKTNSKLNHKNKSQNNSELSSKNENKSILKLEKQNKSHLKSARQNKPRFDDLDPALHIDEKKAAEYLGISHKTLQGYRVKGGGPPFIKIGERAVRYKIADLMAWAENRKKRNTSE